jgi:hypothetical protein
VVAGTVASVLGRSEQRFHLALGKEVLGPAGQIVRLWPRLDGTVTLTAAGRRFHGRAILEQITCPSISLFPYRMKG